MNQQIESGLCVSWIYGCDEDLMEAFSKVKGLPMSDPQNYFMVEADFAGRRLVVVGSDEAIRAMAKANGRCGNG